MRSCVCRWCGEAVTEADERYEAMDGTAVHAACFIKISLDLLQLAHAEALFLVHIAERAFIVAASDRDLNDQAVRLGRRTEYAALIFKHSVSS